MKFYILLIILILRFSYSWAIDSKAEQAIVIDFTTNEVLFEKNADQTVPPASMTKIMTSYVVFDSLKNTDLSIEDTCIITPKAYRKGGSRTFLEIDEQVSISDLLRGIIIQSGNDASIAIAECLAGTEDDFAKLMNVYAEKINMENTNFLNSSGWPDENHFSSAADIAKISSFLIKDFPEHYSLYKEKWFTYGVKQPHRNRNTLLWQDDSIDGIKTGSTEAAGYCLVSSGIRNETRLIAVTMNSSSEKTRLTDNRRLLDYGFRYFRTKKLVSKDQNL